MIWVVAYFVSIRSADVTRCLALGIFLSAYNEQLTKMAYILFILAKYLVSWLKTFVIMYVITKLLIEAQSGWDRWSVRWLKRLKKNMRSTAFDGWMKYKYILFVDCYWWYVGETGQCFETRKEEHITTVTTKNMWWWTKHCETCMVIRPSHRLW